MSVEGHTQTKERPFSRDDVLKIVNSVISRIEGQPTRSVEETHFYQELQSLAYYIDTTKKEIAEIKPESIGNEHIPAATDELDAVVAATEEATTKIMDSCEVIEKALASLPEGDNKNNIADSVTNIYEACGFQDITGQRITKVITAMSHIESQVSKILSALGQSEAILHAQNNDQSEEKPQENKLENGPQLPDKAISQEEIDKLLDSF